MKNIPLSLAIPFMLMGTACGGGGGGTVPPTTSVPPPPVVTGPTWTAGVFEADSKFEARCASPRTGTNPATGNAFPDVAGSALEEKHWLRSWSNDTYLWYSEIADVNPTSIADRVAYFDVLKTQATTASGRDKDQFHFNQNTAEYQQRVSSGASSGYGVHYAFIQNTVPRDLRISFTEPNSPATTANLERGAIILEIDGVDLVNDGTQAGVDTLNAGLFPSADGESHTFKVRDLNSNMDRTVTLTSATVTRAPVHIAKTMDVGGKKVGYLHFTTFGTTSAEKAVIDAFTQFETDGIEELVIDLRYNGGGFLAIAGEIGYMVAGETQSNGKIFDKLTFNDKHTVNDPVTGQTLSPTPFYNTSQGFSVTAGQALPSVDLTRVFILSTSGTCSASEAVINGLRGADVEVVLVGTTTCGKPYGFYPTDNCGETYFTVQFKGENNKGFGDYSDGFTPIDAVSNSGELIPGCEVNDDFGDVLGDENEAQFATALSYMQTGICPSPKLSINAPTKLSRDINSDDATSLFSDKRVRDLYLLEHSLILNRPSDKREN